MKHQFDRYDAFKLAIILAVILCFGAGIFLYATVIRSLNAYTKSLQAADETQKTTDADEANVTDNTSPNREPRTDNVAEGHNDPQPGSNAKIAFETYTWEENTVPTALPWPYNEIAIKLGENIYDQTGINISYIAGLGGQVIFNLFYPEDAPPADTGYVPVVEVIITDPDGHLVEDYILEWLDGETLDLPDV